MSDYKDELGWCEKWDALYWSFIDTHYDQLQKENRLGFVSMQYQKMSKEKINAHKKNTQEFLDSL
jgi:deoxyribodipyrimidine photolyase-related protein